MDTRMFYPILFAVLILFAVAALLIMRKRKSDQLKQRFGPEYGRVVQQHGNTRLAEAALSEREKRVEKFAIHPLPAGDRERYADEWAGVQRRFVDDPSMAVTEADKLVTKVMTAPGYPRATSSREPRTSPSAILESYKTIAPPERSS